MQRETESNNQLSHTGNRKADRSCRRVLFTKIFVNAFLSSVGTQARASI